MNQSEKLLIEQNGRLIRLFSGIMDPEYFTVWYSANAGFDRIDQWQRIFDERAPKGYESPLQRVAGIETAGCYKALRNPVRCENAIYYVETVYAAGRVHSSVQGLLTKGPAVIHRFQLVLLAQRVGHLGRSNCQSAAPEGFPTFFRRGMPPPFQTAVSSAKPCHGR